MDLIENKVLVPGWEACQTYQDILQQFVLVQKYHFAVQKTRPVAPGRPESRAQPLHHHRFPPSSIPLYPFCLARALYPLDAFALILRLRIVATFLSKAAKNYQVIVRVSLFLVTAVATKSVYDESLSRESISDRWKSFPPLFSSRKNFRNKLIKIATASPESRNDFPRDVNSMTGEEYQTVINMYSGNRLAWYPLLPLLYSSCL